MSLSVNSKTDSHSVTTLSDMLALGLGLDATTFSTAGRYGPHLLAPTASYLSPPPPKDTILAGFHTDLNFITIHGRSRYPGLNIWARNTGKRIPVKIPPPPPNGTGGAYLLVQAGKQLEHLTGGLIKAGYHEVVINSSTLTTLQSRTLPNRPSIRISSTFFWHLASDYDLAPIPKLAARAREMRMAAMDSGAEGEEEEYPSMKVGVQVQK